MRHGITLASFQGHTISMFVKALKINRPVSANVTTVFSEQALLNIIKVSETLEYPDVFTALYLLAFFSFLRLSNLVPHARAHYDLFYPLSPG